MVGCIYTKGPRQGERFCLRIIHFHRKGGTSLALLKAADGIRYCTCRETRQRLGLLTDDAKWKRAMRNGFVSSYQAHTNLFALIISHYRPAEQKELVIIQKDMFFTDPKADFEMSWVSEMNR